MISGYRQQAKQSDCQQLKSEQHIRICRGSPCKVFAFPQMRLKDTFSQ